MLENYLLILADSATAEYNRDMQLTEKQRQAHNDLKRVKLPPSPSFIEQKHGWPRGTANKVFQALQERGLAYQRDGRWYAKTPGPRRKA